MKKQEQHNIRLIEREQFFAEKLLALRVQSLKDVVFSLVWFCVGTVFIKFLITMFLEAMASWFNLAMYGGILIIFGFTILKTIRYAREAYLLHMQYLETKRKSNYH